MITVFSLLFPSLAAIGEVPPPSGDSREAPAPKQVTADAPVEPPLEGIWPTPKLLNLMLRRWLEESCEQYDLSEDQRSGLREDFVEEWTEFFSENRSSLQPLVNEFIEMRVGLEPPGREIVQSWAERMSPVFEKGRDQIRKSQSQFREVMQPMQRIRFEAEALQMNAALSFAELKLKQWQEGEFDDDDFWDGKPGDNSQRDQRRRKRREQEREIAAQADSSPPADQISLEMDAWRQYVEQSVESFRLDEGQRTTALSCLKELQERALAHRDRRREDISRLEEKIREAPESDEELADVKRQLTELYGPVDEMFRELKARIESLPTSEQRAAANASAVADEKARKRPSSEESTPEKVPASTEKATFPDRSPTPDKADSPVKP